MNDINLAIVTFHNDESERQMCGIVTAPVCLRDSLLEFTDISYPYLISTNYKSKNQSFPGDYHIVEFNHIEIFNEFDFIIFISPGRPTEKLRPELLGHNYDWVLDGLTTPFAITINEERDRTVYPYYSEFINHPAYSHIIYNSDDMHEDFEDLANGRSYSEINFLPKFPDFVEVMGMAKLSMRSNVVRSTARWTDRKRVKELVDLAIPLSEKGFSTKVASTSASYFYTQKVKNSPGYDQVEFTGHYTPADLDELFEDTKFHYNFVYLKRKVRDRVMRPRIEIASLEALFRGVLPIVCKETVPEWFWNNGAIGLNPDELESLPQVLSEISDDDYLDRIVTLHSVAINRISKGYDILGRNIKNIVRGVE